MGKNIIVSEDTVRDLLEAHASLSAWYYELSAALRAAQGTARSPDDQARAAFVERLAQDFPEVAAVARSIRVPRMFVPPPPAMATRPLEEQSGDEQSTLIEPAQARFRTTGSNPPVDGDTADAAARAPTPGPAAGAPPPAAGTPPVAAPPPVVDPSKVKY
jgi:hypothetical protein